MRWVDVALSGPTAYEDLPAIPRRLATGFGMYVWEDDECVGEQRFGDIATGGPDVVSDTIAGLGVWEPADTLILLSAFVSHPASVFLDLGCQVGWFSMLALASGLEVVAVDANQGALDILEKSADDGIILPEALITHRALIDENFVPPVEPGRSVIVKMDLEGAEPAAVDALAPRFENGDIELCLAEISPVFHDGYTDMIRKVIGWGYECWQVPDKMYPPPVVEHVGPWLYTFGRSISSAQGHQFNAVFLKPDFRWG